MAGRQAGSGWWVRHLGFVFLLPVGSHEALWQVLQLPDRIRASPELSTALAINGAYLECNFARLFRLARELPYLPSCALHPHVAKARCLALLIFSHGFSAKNCSYPLARLSQLLAMDSLQEATDFCKAQGLTVAAGGIVFQKSSYKALGHLEHSPSHLLVQRKWGTSTVLELAEGVCS